MTGANKGIGYGIIEYSLQKAGVNTYHFLLGSRDLQRGEEARQKLITQFPGAGIEVVALEVTSEASAQALVAHLQKTGPLDILINNAGIAPDKPGNLGEEVMKEVQSVNYHSPRRLIDLLLQHQLVKPNGKIINVSSSMAKFSSFGNTDPFTKEALGNYSLMKKRLRLRPLRRTGIRSLAASMPTQRPSCRSTLTSSAKMRESCPKVSKLTACVRDGATLISTEGPEHL